MTNREALTLLQKKNKALKRKLALLKARYDKLEAKSAFLEEMTNKLVEDAPGEQSVKTTREETRDGGKLDE